MYNLIAILRNLYIFQISNLNCRFYGAKCSGCFQSIPANEFIMRAMDNIYHLQCFVCVLCGYQLQKGDQFVIKDGRVFCRPDYEKEFLYRYDSWDGYPPFHTGSECYLVTYFRYCLAYCFAWVYCLNLIIKTPFWVITFIISISNTEDVIEIH